MLGLVMKMLGMKKVGVKKPVMKKLGMKKLGVNQPECEIPGRKVKYQGVKCHTTMSVTIWF